MLQPLAYNCRHLDQKEIWAELEEISKDSSIEFFSDASIYTFKYEKLYELLFMASSATLVDAVHLLNGTDTFNLSVLSSAYVKSKFSLGVNYKDFSRKITDFRLLKLFYSICWTRHTLNNQVRDYTSQWINQQPENDEQLCHKLLDAYDFEFMPIHCILRVAHCKARSPVIGAMFAALTANVTPEQFNLLPESVRERFNNLTNFFQ